MTRLGATQTGADDDGESVRIDLRATGAIQQMAASAKLAIRWTTTCGASPAGHVDMTDFIGWPPDLDRQVHNGDELVSK